MTTQLNNAEQWSTQVQQERAAQIAKWQNESFPQDPVMLLGIDMLVGGENPPPRMFALPITPLPNLNTVVDAVFFQVIEGDTLVELTFAGIPIVIRKVVFSSFAEIQHAPSLTVFEEEQYAVRASKILLGLPGIKK